MSNGHYRVMGGGNCFGRVAISDSADGDREARVQCAKIIEMRTNGSGDKVKGKSPSCCLQYSVEYDSSPYPLR